MDNPHVSAYDTIDVPLSLEFVALDPIVKDIDIASDAFVDVLRIVSKIISQDVQGFVESEPCIGTSITPALSRAVGTGNQLVPSGVYDILVRSWVSSLPAYLPSRARIAVERTARTIAGQLCLAGYQYPFNGEAFDDDSVRAELVDEKKELVLPIRRKSSATVMPQKGKEKVRGTASSPMVPSKVMGDSGFAGTAYSPRRGLPTPEPTPSLRSRSSFSSTNQTESTASGRLRLLTQILPQAYSADSTSNILKHWVEGVDPWEYDWERTQQAIEAETQAVNLEEASQSQKRDRAEKCRKRRLEDTIGISSKPVPTRFKGSQPQMGVELETQGSSMSTQPMVMSQVEPGLHGSRRKYLTKRNAPKRMAGF